MAFAIQQILGPVGLLFPGDFVDLPELQVEVLMTADLRVGPGDVDRAVDAWGKYDANSDLPELQVQVRMTFGLALGRTCRAWRNVDRVRAVDKSEEWTIVGPLLQEEYDVALQLPLRRWSSPVHEDERADSSDDDARGRLVRRFGKEAASFPNRRTSQQCRAYISCSGEQQ